MREDAKGASLGLLLRTQIRELLSSKEAESQEGGEDRKGKRRRKGSGYRAMLVTSIVLMVAILSMYLVMLAFPLSAMGMLSIYPMLGAAGASVFVLITTIYNTNGMLFGFKDYEMVSALPFATRTVVTCRFLLVYLWELADTAIIMVPVGIIYGAFASPPLAFWLTYFLLMLMVPLLPCVVAALIGMLIALLTRRSRKSGMSKTILTVVFLVAWMLFCFSFSSIGNEDAIAQAANALPGVMGVLQSVYPPAAWFTEACVDFSMGSLALFAGISLGASALFVLLVGRRYKQVNARLAPVRAKSDYRLTTLEGESPRKALLKREWKRLIGSSTYFTNTCIGYIMVLIFSFVMVLVPSLSQFITQFEEMADAMEAGIVMHGPVLMAVFLSMFMLISSPCVCSVSLEGKTIWILKTLPVSAREVLRSKLSLGAIIAVGTAVVSGVVLWCSAPDMGLWGLACILMPVAYGLWGALFGLWLDLKSPNLDWVTETQVAKRGKAPMTLSYSGLGIGFAGFFASMFFGDIVAVIGTVVVFVLDIVVYRSLMRNGPARFRACGAAAG